jgi:hypothetical protein
MVRRKVRRREGVKVVTPVVVYLDDLNELHAILTGTEGRPVSVTTSAYYLDGFQDLPDIPGKRLHDLTLRIADPFVMVDFQSVGAAVIRLDNTTDAMGVAEYARILLRRCRRRPRWFYTYPFLLLLAVPTLVWFVAGLVWNVKGHTTGTVVSAATSLFSAIACYGFLTRAFRGSIINLRRRADAQSFWSRNRDALLVALIAALLGALLTGLLTYLLTR